MTYTLDVRGDMTFVKDDTGKTVGMVQPDPYEIHGWTSWTPNWRIAGGYERTGIHDTREQALAECGYVEAGR